MLAEDPQYKDALGRARTIDPALRNARIEGVSTLLYNQAVQLRKTGEIEASREGFKAVLETDPDHADALYALAVSYQKTGDTKQAVQHYAQLLQVNPDHEDTRERTSLLSKTLNEQALDLRRAGNFEASQDCFETLLELDPTHSETRYALGVSYQKTGEADKALDHFLVLLAEDPQYKDALGRARAIDPALRNANLPGVTEVLYNQALELRRAGDIEGSRDRFQGVLQADPEHRDALYALGVSYQKTGQREEALAHFERLLDIESSYKDAAQRATMIGN